MRVVYCTTNMVPKNKRVGPAVVRSSLRLFNELINEARLRLKQTIVYHLGFISSTKRSEGQHSAQERRKEKSIRYREKTQGETAGEEDETDWEEAGKERREDA